ncbi:MAG: cytochrome c oxidase subunit II [Candidatus Nanopelagicales bacterium]
MGAAAALVLLTATGCTANEAFFFDLPDPASEQAPITQNLWNGAWIAAWAVGVLTWGLMLFAFFVYRRRKNSPELPEQTRYNIPIEVLYTVVPLILIIGLFYFTARDQAELTAVRNDEDLTVNVVGWRWSWGFNYLDEDVYEAGTPGVPPTLVLPVDEKVRFELTSPDVIHSFWVPAWLFKMDVIPGRTNVFEVTPNKIGTFAGKCAELCGVDHSRMLFNVKVVERAEYDAFIAELKAKGQTGLLETGRTTDEGMTEQEKQL